MMAPPAFARLTSDSVMPPTPVEMTSTLTCSVDSLVSALRDRLGRALHVGLEDDLQLLDLAALDLCRGCSRARPWPVPASSFLRRASRRCSTSSLAAFSSATALKTSPASGTPSRPEHLDRRRRAGLGERLPLVVEHGADLPDVLAGDDGSPSFSVPSWTSTVAIGPRLRSSLASMTCPLRRLVRVGLELEHLGLDSEILQELVDALLGLAPRRRRRWSRRPTPPRPGRARRACCGCAPAWRPACRSC